jgi:hypothetical protein
MFKDPTRRVHDRVHDRVWTRVQCDHARTHLYAKMDRWTMIFLQL